MRLPILLAGVLVLSALATEAIQAQDEAHLRKALEGKRITLKMDMPATSEGVDVHPGTNRPVDYDKVGKRMKKHGIALKDGDPARITRVKVKENHIEIQLNGGGFGTFGDALGQLKHQDADSGTAQQMRFQNQRVEKLAAGSRFNLRYVTGVDPDHATPAAVIRALEEYATFPAGIVTAVATQASYSHGSSSASDQSASSGKGLRKGLSTAEVEQMAGRPFASATNNQIVTNKYNWQDGVLEADFFNGVLVGYRTSSK